jgi:hypothetical protein
MLSYEKIKLRVVVGRGQHVVCAVLRFVPVTVCRMPACAASSGCPAEGEVDVVGVYPISRSVSRAAGGTCQSVHLPTTPATAV